MDRISDSAHIRENTDLILFTYRKIRIRESPHFRAMLRRLSYQRFSYQTFDQNQPVSENSAGYKETSAIKEVHYREVLP